MRLILKSTGQTVYPLHYAGQHQYWPVNFLRVLVPNNNGGRPHISYIRKDKLQRIRTAIGEQGETQ